MGHRLALGVIASGLAGLEDRSRPGRPRVISASQIGRILAEMDVRPHKMRSLLNRRDDPEFWERASDVCGLYLSPPRNALVLSVDEKTAVGARSPRYPTRPASPGVPERREFEYRRHGTANFIAALDVGSGEVLAADVDRNTAANFIGILDDLDRSVDPALEVHLIMDNGSGHVAKATRAWLSDHPRFVAHYTPKHASWLNQVELLFSILTRRLLKRGEFGSRDELVSRVTDFIRAHNQRARPFAWTYAGTPLKTSDPCARHFCAAALVVSMSLWLIDLFTRRRPWSSVLRAPRDYTGVKRIHLSSSAVRRSPLPLMGRSLSGFRANP